MNTPILPPMTLTPADAIRAFEEGRARAEQQLRDAKTVAERHFAQHWIDSADRNLAKWHALAAKAGQR